MIDISKWRLTNADGKDYGQIVTSIETITGGRAVHKALNGGVYIQTIGGGVTKTAIEIIVETQQAKVDIDKANCEGEFLAYYYRGKTYFGYIEDDEIDWETLRPGTHYKGACVFLVDHVISDQ